MADTVTLQISEDQLLDALRRLTPERRRESLARLGEQPQPDELRASGKPIPASKLMKLTGVIAVGGDALLESENIYED